MFGRAVLLKCPLCGSRRTFIRRWLGRHERCRTCGIEWHREQGFELGPIALNSVFTFTNTLWLAFDLLSHKPDDAELAEAAQVAVQVTGSPR